MPHHVTQRGNYRQIVFEEEQDCLYYCLLMNKYSKKYDADILAYCLMSNHVHFIITPRKEASLARTFNTVHMRYAQYVNKKKRLKGHLWESRFFSCVLDETHLYRAVRYVEKNPVRASMVKEAWDYPWSSAKTHVGIRPSIFIPIKKSLLMDAKEWKRYLQQDDSQMTLEMRLKTQRGLVVGSQPMIEQLEKKLKRSLACLNPGRPCKK